MKKLNLIGQVFGRLTVKSKAPACLNLTRWNCECSCGNLKTVYQTHLRSGSTVSCGRHRKERVTTHGRSHTNLYILWTGFRGLKIQKNLSIIAYVAVVNSSLGPKLSKSGFDTAQSAAIVRDIHSIPVPLNFPELALQGPL